MRKVSSLGVFLIVCAYCCIAVVAVARSQQRGESEDLPPSPLEAFAGRSTAKVVWSKTIGSLEGSEARATVTALAVEDSTQTPAVMRGVRIDLKHLVPNPDCSQKYLAWRVMCSRANAAVFIEEERVRTWLRHGSGELRPGEYISQYWSGGYGRVLSTGLIVCGYEFPGRTPSELAELFGKAINALGAAPR
jgi:hypothetical protein